MIEPWNNALLAPPPVNTFHCPNRSHVDILTLNNTLEDMKQILSSQSPLHQEAAILSRLIYKFDKKFRHDVGYRNLKKVNTALKKYLKVNLLRIIENFFDVVPSSNSDEDYLPTRQMLQYVLVRILSFCKIMVRIIVYAKLSAIFYWDRVTRGESHWMSLMPYAVMARIWTSCTVILRQGCQWYTALYQYHNQFEMSGIDFLPPGYSLPDDVNVWLDIPNIDEHAKLHWSRCKLIEITSCLEDDENADTVDIFQYAQNARNKICNKNELEEPEETGGRPILKSLLISAVEKKEEDLGEQISRDNFKNIFENIKSNVSKMVNQIELEVINKPQNKKIKIEYPQNCIPVIKSNHSLDSVNTKNDIKIFLAKEERFRNGKNGQSLSDHLGFMQWQSLKMAINNILDSELPDKKVLKKIKTLWKVKCTNCRH